MDIQHASTIVEDSVHTINDNYAIDLAFAAGRTDTELKHKSLTWQEARELFAKPLDSAECTLEEYQAASSADRGKMKDGIGIVPARLKDPAKGRKTENVDTVTMIMLDIDSGMPIEEVVRIMEGTESVIHTTFSHTPALPKLRVVLPLRQPARPAEAKMLFDIMQERFGGRLDSACFDVARLYYLPRCPKDAEHLFQSIHLEGKPFDLVEEIAVKLASALRASAPRSPSTPAPGTPAAVTVGERNSTLAAQVGTWLREGRSEEEIPALAKKWNDGLQEPLSEKEVITTVRSVLKTAERKHAALMDAADKAIEALNKEYVFLTKRSMVVRLSDARMVTKEQMRDLYANQVVTVVEDGMMRRKNAFEAWLKSSKRNQLDDFIMAPGQRPVFNNCLNLWRGWGAQPKPGDISLWTELVNHLFGEGTEEARYFEQWVAYPFQHPGAKLTTAVVIWSTQQGIGKSLIGTTIAKLYGQHATTISARELHDKYNGWAKSALFVVGEENSGSDRRADSNRLKHMITGETHHIHEKYQPAIELKNLSNFVFTSNHPDAFHVESDDRRLFIVCANVQPKPLEFYERYGEWMNSAEGQAALMDHFLHVDVTGFNPHGHAPRTAAKAEMIEMSKTDVERFAADVFTDDFVDNLIGSEVTSLDELTDHFNKTTKGQRSNPTAMAKALRRCAAYSHNRVSTSMGRKKLISIRNHERWALADKSAWVEEYEKGKSTSVARDMDL